MYTRLSSEVKMIIHNIVQLADLHGGMSYNDILFTMSYIEREIAAEYINKKFEMQSQAASGKKTAKI